MKHPKCIFASFLLACVFMAGNSIAEPPPIQKPSSEKDIQSALSGGVPGKRWKEGLLFEGVKPMPWLQSAANWFPGTEDIQSNASAIHHHPPLAVK